MNLCALKRGLHGYVVVGVGLDHLQPRIVHHPTICCNVLLPDLRCELRECVLWCDTHSSACVYSYPDFRPATGMYLINYRLNFGVRVSTYATFDPNRSCIVSKNAQFNAMRSFSEGLPSLMLGGGGTWLSSHFMVEVVVWVLASTMSSTVVGMACMRTVLLRTGWLKIC